MFSTRRILPIGLVPLVLTACSAGGDEPAPPAQVAQEQTASRTATGPEPELLDALEAPPDSCLLTVWSGQKERDIDFDRDNDLVEGGAISCATGTSPSQFAAAIESLREAARSGDRARVLQQVGIPLLYIDEAGQRIELTDRQIETLYDDVFSSDLIAMIERMELKDMTVAEAGGFFELGSIWLVVDKAGGRPRLVTVNQQAIAEAAEAAREAARANEGLELPRKRG